MKSIRQVLSSNGPTLLLDTASSQSRVALIFSLGEVQSITISAEAGLAVFSGTEKLLSDAQISLNDVASFVYCDRPGSILGIRSAAVALRTWLMLKPRPCFAYDALRLSAYALCSDNTSPERFSVIADARRDSWHEVKVIKPDAPTPITRVPTSSLSGTLFMPEHFRTWSPLPSGLATVAYDPIALLKAHPDVPLFSEIQEPDAFIYEDPSYQTWAPKIHQTS